jgi:hypothetical protein
MKPEEEMTNVESATLRLQSSPVRHSDFVIDSAFGFRHSFGIRISSLTRPSGFVIDSAFGFRHSFVTRISSLIRPSDVV